MKNMRIPLIIAWGIAVIGIVFGSLFDLSISTAIASPTNGFALAMSAILPTIGFAGVAAMGGGFIAFIVKGNYKTFLKVLFGLMAAVCFGISIYYPAGEYFGINGFYGAAPEWVGYLIVIIPEAAAGFGGYLLFKDCQNENMWIIFVIIAGILAIALLGAVTGLKSLMHRPRYRLISANADIAFHNWWEPCKNYKDLMELYDIPKDNFKSYPSGHTAEVSILFVAATFFPLANKKYQKYQLPAFIVAGALTLLVAIARILAAAHYLSDVSWGATIMLTLSLIANEVVMRIKPLALKEE
ncbi:MAG: phosphatase PAP2 family protein [Bacilli bacterium]|nr:phosphatase PAP2 family protein [Bacilli bacterium]